MSLLNSKYTAELAYEKDANKYVFINPNNGEGFDSVDSLDKIKNRVKEHNIETLICYENDITGLSQEDINKLTRLLMGKKKEKEGGLVLRKGCLVLKESDPLASTTYDPVNPFSD
jgi:hypothetical protein